MSGAWYDFWIRWFPPEGSSVAWEVDWLYRFILWICVFFFVLIVGLTTYFVVKFRRRPGGPMVGTETHSTALEITWSVIPSLICMLIFYWGFTGYLNMKVPPKNTYEIQVTAWQWAWSFTHPDGTVEDMSTGLHLPADRPVKLVIKADDVMHAFYIPAFRVKHDAVPGRYSKLWFEPKIHTDAWDASAAAAVYDLQCAEYCGKGHSQMNAKVYVLKPGDFAKGDWAKPDPNKKPWERGELLYKGRGCAGCHSVDGASGTGPTWKGLFGSNRAFTSGESAVADENYLRQSILEPMAHVVSGYQPVMPSYKGKLKDQQIDDLIAYIRHIDGK